MKKIIAAINMTLDGFCDHTAVNADDELHIHYNELLRTADCLLYGRTTYQLMEDSWPAIVNNPTGNIPTDEFAVLIDNLPKIVYSRTLKNVVWKNSVLKNEIIVEEILALKNRKNDDNKNIFVGSPGLIVSFAQLGLIDEFQLCVHPVILGKGLPLFKNISERINLELIKTITFKSGAVVLYYETVKNN